MCVCVCVYCGRVINGPLPPTPLTEENFIRNWLAEENLPKVYGQGTIMPGDSPRLSTFLKI